MKLSEKEALVISCIELEADLPMDEIKQRSGLQEHAIRYHLHALEERGIIRRRPFINVVPAGYDYYGVYFSPALNDGSSKEELIKFISAMPEVTWLAELGGDYSYGMALCTQNIHQVEGSLNTISEKFPAIFFDKVIACQFRARTYGRRYLGSAVPKKQSRLEISSTGKIVELDEVDKKILGALATSELRSRRQVAQALGMPLSTVDGRVKKLEEAGVIAGYFYDVDAQKFGMEVATLLVFSKGLSRKSRDAVRKFADACKNVTFTYECLGSWDFELNVDVSEGREISTISSNLSTALGNQVNSVKVLSKYRDLKYSFVPFLAL